MQTMPIISSKALQSRTAGVVCSFHGVRNFSAASWQAQRFCHACGKATPRKLAPYHQGTSDAVARVFAPKEIKRRKIATILSFQEIASGRARISIAIRHPHWSKRRRSDRINTLHRLLRRRQVSHFR